MSSLSGAGSRGSDNGESLDDGTMTRGADTGEGTVTPGGSGDDNGTTGDDDDDDDDDDTDGTTGGTFGTGGTTGADSGSDTGGDTEGDDAGSSGTGGPQPCEDADDCDDGQFCNGEEICGDSGFCEAGTDPECDDDVGCTVDACDEAADACIAVADDALCDDAAFCNGAETCDVFDDCQPGIAPDCDDGVACTVDTCDDDAGACSFVPDDDPCQDEFFCNGPEVCHPIDGCQPSLGDVDCDDLTLCTSDMCDEDADTCVNDPNDGDCDNGLYCDGVEVCVSGMGCVDGDPVACADEDGIECTVEQCDDGVDDCVIELDNGICADLGFDFCTDVGCVVGMECDVDADCDDLNACNGLETCDTTSDPGVCQPGVPETCGDGNSCTDDSCNDLGDNVFSCDNVPEDALCDDLDPCDGVETCDAIDGCQPGTPLVCNDGVDCTMDVCIEGFGCAPVPDDAFCDDGMICNGEETCDFLDGCQPDPLGFPCPDDGIACTIESCDEDAGGCIATSDDSVCECGLHCDPGAPGAGADGCTDACSIATCDGTLWQCGDCEDNDMDCDVDDEDTDCFGVCDNNEAGFDGAIPGQDAAPCKADCYFDDESGAGGGDCVWSLNCDPLNPQPDTCECILEAGETLCDANVPGSMGASCEELFDVQPANCEDLCGPITPNGCDCFGCCEVGLPAGGTTTVYLGSESGGDPSCHAGVVGNPALCHPCTQVPACLNTCDECELCFGETELPPECGGIPECPADQDPCGVPGLPDCPAGMFCLTGCCSEF